MTPRYILVFAILLGVLASTPAAAAVINVPGDQPSIQSAVMAAVSGDVVALHDGIHTVTGQVVINKNITITGAGRAITIIEKNEDTGFSGDDRCWFLVGAGSSLALEDLTIDGHGRDICEAIRAYGALTVTRCALRNISYPAYQGTAIVLFGSGTVSNSLFTDIGRIGVLAYGAYCVNAGISNNTFKGKGAGDHLDYAIEVGGGARASISSNNISECKGVAAGEGLTSAGIHVTSEPGTVSVATILTNVITRCAIGIDIGFDLSDNSTVTATNNSIAGNVLGVRYAGRDRYKANFNLNWWGSSSGPGFPRSGQGDRYDGLILCMNYLFFPNIDKAIYLEAHYNGGIFAKPNQNITLYMRVAYLTEMVKGCQAMLGYDSSYFNVGTIAPGGGEWDDLIYQSWAVPGELDTAIGVKGTSTSGTQINSTIAVITLNTRNKEGMTQVVFRPDADPDPGLVKSTFFAGMYGNPVWPVKVDSTNICVDGTPPSVSITSARQGNQELLDANVNAAEGVVNISITASDAVSGLSGYEPPVVTVTSNTGTAQSAAFVDESPAGTFNYTWSVTSATPNGPALIRASASDRSGNTAESAAKTINVGWPFTGNVLYLNTPTAYVKPNSNITVRMDAAQLPQMVTACQAMLGYDSEYLNMGNVAPGGGDWDDLIYQSWAVSGEIDTAVGVKGQSTAGTQADGTVALITFSARNKEGMTQVVFRPDASPDPGLVKCTIFADMNSNPVWPAKLNSSYICIDGTAPSISTVSVRQGARELLDTGVNAIQGTVRISVAASDELSGIETPPAVTVTPNGGTAEPAVFLNESPAGTYNYSWTVTPNTPDGLAAIDATVSDRSGNSSSAAARTVNVSHATGNILYMEAPLSSGANIYVKPYGNVTVAMKVANLLQRVNGCQAMIGFSTNHLFVGSVTAGGGDWDELIYQSWSVPGEIDAAIGVRGTATTGTQADGTVVLITLIAKNIEGVTRLVFRPDEDPDPGLVKSTFFSSMNGTPVWPAKIGSTSIYIDGGLPVITITGVKQAGQNLVGSGLNAIRGVVNISVAAGDTLSGIGTPPVVTVSPNGGTPQTASFVNESPAGTYNYTWTVAPAVPNGDAIIRASVYDRSGNIANAQSKTIRVNKNTISGQIELEAFVGSTRRVTFVTYGLVMKTWNLDITGFSGGVATYTLTDVPDGVTSLSARTSWNLRRKLVPSGGINGQWTIDLIGVNKLLGGDLDGSNHVYMSDYILMRANWFTTNLSADINGDGQVSMWDYAIMKSNWLVSGDS